MLYQYYISFATFYYSKSTLNFYHIYNKYLIKIRPDSNFNIYRLMILITFLRHVLKLAMFYIKKTMILAENIIKIK